MFAGVGIPLLAATLAQRNFAPHLTILFEGGTIGPFIVPGELPPSTNEQRCTRRANMVLPITDVLLLLQRGYVDVGFMGGAQIDRFGNLNSSFIGDADNPEDPAARHRRRQRHLLAHQHDRGHEAREAPLRGARSISSPRRAGSTAGARARERGLPQGGMWRVVTDLAILGFDEETREMKVLALQSGRDARAGAGQHRLRAAVRGAAGDDLPAGQQELAVLRELDPERLYTA